MNELFISGEAEGLAATNPRKLGAISDAAFREAGVLLVWGRAPWFDPFIDRWFNGEARYEHNNLRVFVRTGDR